MKLVIIDDDALITSALKMILEAEPGFHVVAAGSDGAEALPLYKEHRPDVLLMDIRMKNVSGLEAAEQILSFDPGAKILLLTTFSDDEYIVRAIKAGTKGYVLKQDYESLVPCIHTVSMGQTVFGDEILAKIPSLLENEQKTFSFEDYGLNSREYEIISLVAEGLSNKEISSKLYLGDGTVRNYLSTILDKLQLHNRTQLAIFYYKTHTTKQED